MTLLALYGTKLFRCMINCIRLSVTTFASLVDPVLHVGACGAGAFNSLAAKHSRRPSSITAATLTKPASRMNFAAAMVIPTFLLRAATSVVGRLGPSAAMLQHMTVFTKPRWIMGATTQV